MYLINGQSTERLAVNDRGCSSETVALPLRGSRRGDCLVFPSSGSPGRNVLSFGDPLNDWDVLVKEMRSLAQPHREGVLKVMITRGAGGRGYSAASCQLPTRILSVSPYPAHYARWKDEGITLTLSPIPLGRNPYLAGLKHLNRLEQVLIRSHLEQTDADEALVLDSEGWVTECCAANLFWRTGDIVFTPRLDQAGVNGIMRQFCLRQLAQSPFQVLEVQAREEAVRQADEIIICNALMPIIPIRAYHGTSYSSRTLFQFLAPFCEHPN